MIRTTLDSELIFFTKKKDFLNKLQFYEKLIKPLKHISLAFDSDMILCDDLKKIENSSN